MVRMVIAAFALAFSSCSCSEPKVPTKYASADCELACLNLSSLECKTPEGRPYTNLVAGMSCDDGCKRKLLDGVDLHTTCVANAKNCQAVDACAR